MSQNRCPSSACPRTAVPVPHVPEPRVPSPAICILLLMLKVNLFSLLWMQYHSQQIRNIQTCQDSVDLVQKTVIQDVNIKVTTFPHVHKKSTTSLTSNPKQIKPVEFEHNERLAGAKPRIFVCGSKTYRLLFSMTEAVSWNHTSRLEGYRSFWSNLWKSYWSLWSWLGGPDHWPTG